MNVEAELSERFSKAVRDIIKPPVLVSPRWIRPGPAEGGYEFIGTLKIAKAIGRNAVRIAGLIRKAVQVDDLKLEMRTTAAGVIQIVPARPAGSRSRKAGQPR
ncbi:MAG TPA: hypothetical protein VM389_04450 [Phycisphaerae bacterium]|nr:hypothetical protein [Phycisphaerae bacterium]HUU21768.1 hypothetical protein [Phycisphaerae bacterium]